MGKFILNGNEVNISEYLPIENKIVIVNGLRENAIVYDEDGFAKIDYLNRQVSLDIYLYTYYTDGDKNINYDELVKSGILKEIYKVACNDIDDLTDMINSELRQAVSINNSLEHTVFKLIKDIGDKIPSSKDLGDLLKKGVKAINNIDKDTLGILMQGVTQKSIQQETKDGIAKVKKEKKENIIN